MPPVYMNAASMVTYARVVLNFIAIGLLFLNDVLALSVALALIIVAFLMDGLDGIVARKLDITSDYGSVIDIVGDRIVENSLWITFAVIGFVPLWVPLVFIVRSFLVDGVRSYGLSKGKTAWGLMHSTLGVFFVSSRGARLLYGLAKQVSFVLLVLLLIFPSVGWQTNVLIPVTYWTVVFTTIFCVVRGVFSLYDSRKIFNP